MAANCNLGVFSWDVAVAPADQDFGRFERGLPILPDRAWTVTVDIRAQTVG